MKNQLQPATQNAASKIRQMKATTIFIALALVLGFSFSLSAQTTTVWQGGKPGQTTNWNCPANWSEGRVPDEFTQVIIPTGTHYYPVIQNTPTPIDALLMEAGAKLTIEDGVRFSILGETGIFDGIIVLGHIENDGTLEIGEAMNFASLMQVQGNGRIVSPSTGTDKLARQH